MIVYPSVGNTISQNSIHNNGKLGIDLVELKGLSHVYGPTLNDILDVDQGPNLLQNFPQLVTAQAGASTHVVGLLHSRPNTLSRLEFFASAAPDPSGYGEGRRYLGSFLVMTN